jgi:redox-sensing transcriptional repressor
MAKVKISSLPTIRRLPSYLHIIEAAQQEGKEFISGTVIAEELELEPIQVRKDLAITGISGKPRIGFPVGELIDGITRFLDWNHTHNAILVGAGNLGTALAGYSEFNRHGLSILAMFDTNPNLIGKHFHETPVFDLNTLKSKTLELKAELAILTVPSHFAQETADKIIDAGIKSIWNFTNVKLKVPLDVIVQKEDLSSGYAVLAVKMARNR